jgi:hypothetical protein
MPQLREQTQVMISDLGQNHGLLGAVSLAMEYVFDKPFMEGLYAREKYSYEIENQALKSSL